MTTEELIQHGFNFEILQTFLSNLDKMEIEIYERRGFTGPRGFVIGPAHPKYIRIIHGGDGPNSGGVYCFIDKDGNILYAATYSSVTKSSPIRGSIYPDGAVPMGFTCFGIKALR